MKYIRYGISDVVILDKENTQRLYAKVFNEKGEEVADPEVYQIGLENEEGDEIFEDGE